MDFRIVVRKTSQGKPTWYIYTGEKYLGALFLTEEISPSLTAVMLGRGAELVEWVGGPDFTQNAAAS